MVLLPGSARNVCVEVGIIKDGNYEGNEEFVIRMSTTDEDTFIIQPTVTILIEDMDSKSISHASEFWIPEQHKPEKHILKITTTKNKKK